LILERLEIEVLPQIKGKESEDGGTCDKNKGQFAKLHEMLSERLIGHRQTSGLLISRADVVLSYKPG
jgi:hypothetical protein